MPPNLALLIGVVFVFFALRSDRKRDDGDLTGLFWPTAWYLVASTRPLGFWMEVWGLPGSAGDDGAEGSPVDRYFYLLLIFAGVRILFKRRFDWSGTLRRNPWITAFCVYMAISILWSQYPYISFKRYIKIIGSVVMAFVILSNERPLPAMLAVLRRCLYIHLPMSIVCIKYFRSIGVGFDFGGTTDWWSGVASSKNTLGQVVMVGILYFVWEIRRNWWRYKWKNLNVLYLAMGIYLLKGSANSSISMTSISVCLLALAIFFRIQALRLRPAAVRPFVLTIFFTMVVLIVFVAVHSVTMFSADSVFGQMITVLGRDITFTGRTDIWHDVYGAAAGNPLLGVGFGGFWIGRMANIPWNAGMSWVLNQAHNGYIETYLQLGLVGVALLAGTLFSSLFKMLDSIADDFDFASFRITLFLTIVFINITESVYLRGTHHLWLILQVVIWAVPAKRSTASRDDPVQEVPLATPAPEFSSVPSNPARGSSMTS